MGYSFTNLNLATRIPCGGQCHTNATCTGSGSSEKCECKLSQGYYGDGDTCTGILPILVALIFYHFLSTCYDSNRIKCC